MEDTGLLNAIADGDERSLEVLISRYERRLAGFLAVLLSDREDVEEVFWETVTEVWKGAASFQGRSEPCYWILGIARNLAYRRLDRLQRRSSEPLGQHWPDMGPGPDELCLRGEVAGAMPLLKEKHQEVLVLFYWFGYTSREISEATNLPQGTVRTRLYHARKNLKDLLEGASNSTETERNADQDADES